MLSVTFYLLLCLPALVTFFSIYRVNALVFNSKAVVERRGFRPKIFDERLGRREAVRLNLPITGVLAIMSSFGANSQYFYCQ